MFNSFVTRTPLNGVLVILFSLILSYCTPQNRNIKADVRGFDLIYKWDIVKPGEKQAVNVADTLKIIQYENLIAFGIPFTVLDVNVETDNVGNILNENLKNSKKKYRYYVYKLNQANGVIFDSLNSKKGLEFSVDSFLTKKAFKGANFFPTEKDSLIEVIWDQERSISIEKYSTINKLDESYSDSTFFFFHRNFKKLDYSLSPTLDSLRNMKLFKIIMIYNPISKGEKYPFDIPRRELLFEIVETELTSPQLIVELFERYKKCCLLEK